MATKSVKSVEIPIVLNALTIWSMKSLITLWYAIQHIPPNNSYSFVFSIQSKEEVLQKIETEKRLDLEYLHTERVQ